MDKKSKIPNARAMEKMTSDLSRLVQGKDFKSKEELKAYLDGFIGKELPEAPPKSAIQFAQDIMYETHPHRIIAPVFQICKAVKQLFTNIAI